MAQSDIDNGKVVDTATAAGTDTLGGTSPPSDPSTVTIETVPPSPLVGIAKTGAVSPSGDQEAAQAGDTIQYSYLVTNTGNVTLTSVAVDDPTLGPTTCPTPTAPGLAPGSAETCTADAVYIVTQTDVDRGSVTDTATATGTDARGTTAPASNPSTATIDTVVPAPAVSVVKSADASGGDDGPLFTGETISYSYLVTNTGDVTLTSVAVDDPTLGPVTCPPPTVRGLVPNASVTCAANSAYTVTPQDVDRGFVTDTATATGTDTDGDTSPVSAPSTVVVPIGSVTTPPTAPSQLSPGPGPSGTAPPTTTTPTTTPGGPGVHTQAPPTTTPATTPRTSPTSPTSLPAAHGKTTSTTTSTRGAKPSRIAPGTKTATTKPTTPKPTTPKPTTATGPSTRPTASKPTTPQPPKTTTTATSPSTTAPTTTAKTPATTTVIQTPVPKTVPANATGATTPITSTPAAPNGLGRVSTDLGRWEPSRGYGTWATAAGAALAAAAAGSGIVGARRRRRSVNLSHKGQDNGR